MVRTKNYPIRRYPYIWWKLLKLKRKNKKDLVLYKGKSDWSVYEWAKHTYDMWIYWEKCSFRKLARKMNKSCSFVSLRVKIFSYYPHSEIQENLKNDRYSISILSYLIKWLDTLSRTKPEIVEHYTLELIRTTMLAKIEKI